MEGEAGGGRVGGRWCKKVGTRDRGGKVGPPLYHKTNEKK